MDQLSASLRDYLQTIYIVIEEQGGVRSKDIADRLGVRKSSVTGALQALAEKKLINYSPYRVITLTQRGRALAREEVHRFETLKRFFQHVLSVDEADAEVGAQMTKRNVPHQIVKRLTQFVEFLEACPKEYVQWTKELGYHCPPSFCDKRDNCLLIPIGGKQKSSRRVLTNANP